MADQTSKEWTVQGVLHQLENLAVQGNKPAMQVFLKESLPADGVAMAYDDIVKSLDPGDVPGVGRLRHMARSFVVKADMNELARIAHHPDVQSVLPSEVADIHPKPVAKKPV